MAFGRNMKVESIFKTKERSQLKVERSTEFPKYLEIKSKKYRKLKGYACLK